MVLPPNLLKRKLLNLAKATESSSYLIRDWGPGNFILAGPSRELTLVDHGCLIEKDTIMTPPFGPTGFGRIPDQKAVYRSEDARIGARHLLLFNNCRRDKKMDEWRDHVFNWRYDQLGLQADRLLDEKKGCEC